VPKSPETAQCSGRQGYDAMHNGLGSFVIYRFHFLQLTIEMEQAFFVQIIFLHIQIRKFGCRTQN